MFTALLVEKDDAGYRTGLQQIEEDRLPPGDVRVRVAYSTLNYKDALAITGRGPVVRQFPMVPGIDFSGEVTDSRHPGFRVGDKVVLNGWGLGETHWGGLAGLAQVNGDWLIPLPKAFTEFQAMALGTAGYTAALCVLALERHGVTPERGEVIVSGAAGGVGSVALALLARRGYRVSAITGRPQEGAYLKDLGASEVLERSAFDSPGKPLAKERWAGAVDTVGGRTLANLCAAMRYHGVVTACGMAGGMELPATVAPFILRAVSLVGVESVMCPTQERLQAWERLARDFDPRHFDSMVTQIGLHEAIAAATRLLEGQVRGRLVVNVGASQIPVRSSA